MVDLQQPVIIQQTEAILALQPGLVGDEHHGHVLLPSSPEEIWPLTTFSLASSSSDSPVSDSKWGAWHLA